MKRSCPKSCGGGKSDLDLVMLDGRGMGSRVTGKKELMSLPRSLSEVGKVFTGSHEKRDYFLTLPGRMGK